ncbi:MAG: thiamine pyrophosphate-dependent dehydrogenase E1 component subunit alpha [Planctomycetes bacterium]|nr:thiamine pyrophosphate-dependent dehydrogenase E1 component subunit alpha [Planctomycetota bacterium]MCB9868250.1 thiamine pyrophosphate-dependent dehydrogenase E1 component subunit alpha [Planctomycetota bacterium]MCB9888774.1 thiamine pyrophosphate-dependent dehydrogenase E1 component subunit alpha [Planctomycetota bacterium]
MTDRGMGIKPEQCRWMLRTMRRVRQLSERIAALYPTDVMETPVHLCIGQEAVSAGLCAHLTAQDKLFLGHRTHGPALAKGLPLHKLVAELYGRTTGCSRGHGGSMHVLDLEHGIPGSSAIVGGSIALAVGGALSAKLSGADYVSVAYFGDAATNAGVYYESLNFAALRRLPVLFLCEDNGLSNVMPLRQHSAAEIGGVAAQFMPVHRADGTDALSVFGVAGTALCALRAGDGPQLLHCRTKRWMNHQGHLAEPLPDYPIDRQRDCPIRKLELFMLHGAMITPSQIRAIAREIETEIDEAIAFAVRSPFPQPSEVY